MKAYRGRGEIAQFVLNLGARWKGVVNFMPQERTPVPTEQEAGWVPSRSGQFGEEKFSCNNRNCTLDRPACSLVTILAELSELPSEMVWFFVNTGFKQ